MSQINVNTIRNRTGGAPSLDKGAIVTGIVTATTGEFAGDVTVGGVLTYEDVTNIDSTGIVTAKSGIKVGNPVSPGIGATIDPNGNAVFAGIVTANSFRGDGSQLTGIDATAIQTGNTSVQTVDTGTDGHIKFNTEGSERVRVGQLGQIGLGGQNYGDSGQLMTSGGIGAAPTWSDAPAGGNVFTGIASGTLTSNKPVRINDDGKLSEIKNTITDYATPLISPSTSESDSGRQIIGSTLAVAPGICWNANHKFFIAVYSTSDTSYDGFAKTLTPTSPGSSAPKLGNEVPLGSSVHHKYTNVAYDLVNNQMLMFGLSSGGGHSGQGTDSLARAAVSSDGTITPYQYAIGSVDSYGSGSTYEHWPNICYIGNGTFACMSYRGTAPAGAPYDRQSVACSIWKWNGSGNNLYANPTNQTVNSAGAHGRFYKIAPIGSNGQFVMAWTSGNSGTGEGWYRVGTYDGSSLTLGTAAKFADYAMSSPCSVTYDENSGKVVFLMEKDSDSSRIYSRVGTISGNDLTLGTEVRVDDTNGSAQDSQDVTIVYAPTKQQVYASYTVNDGGTRKARSKFGTVSGNSITWSSSAYNFKNPDGNVVRYLHTVAADSSMQAGIIMHTWKWNNDDYGYAKQIDFASVVSNLTNANQYVGYPDQQYTDAQTATIKTLGNNVSLSGLSTSSDYYVQQDGSLATTKDTVEVYAGRALSDNKFLINLPVPPTLGWEVVSSHVLDGSTQNYDFTGWSNRYAEYQVILDNVYNSSGFKIWIQVYTDATSGNDGTLQTSANYGYGAPYARADTMVNQVQGNGYWGKNQHILGLSLIHI